MTALVQSRNAANAAGTSFTCTVTSAAGNTLTATITAYNGSNTPIRIASITDSAGNTWQYSKSLNSQSPPAGGGWDPAGTTYGFSAVACCIGASAVTSVTVTFAAAVDFAEVGVQEWSGLPAGSALMTGASSGTPAVGVTAYTAPAVILPAPVLVITATSGFTGWTGVTSGWNLLSYTDPLAAWTVPAAGGSVQASFAGVTQDVPSAAVLAIGRSFPASGVPVYLRAELSAGGWQDISPDVYQREGTSPAVSITRGRADETSQASPASCTYQLNNRLGKYSPKNPLGPWYGVLGRNTPVRFSVPAQANYLRLEDAISAAACAGSASLDITGDTDIRVDMTLTGTGPFGVTVAGKGYNGIYTGSQATGLGWLLALNADLTPQLYWTPDGSSLNGIPGALPVPARGRFALRATLAVATSTVTYYTAPTMAGPFTQLGPSVSFGTSTSVYAPAGHNSPVSAGMLTSKPSGAVTYGGTGICGRVHELQLRSGIGGTLVANPVFSSQAAGATSFNDTQGNTWSMYGAGAEISNRDYRGHFETSALPPRWDTSGNDQWVAVTAGGLLRRLGQGSAPLLSPMARYYTVPGAPVTAAYWPMEEPQGSTQFGALTGSLAATWSGSPTLASQSPFLGSSPLPVINGAVITARVAYTGTWTDNDVHWLMQVPQGGEPDGTVVAAIATSGSVALLTVTYNTASSGSLTLRGYDGSGTLLFTSSAFTGVNGQAYAVQAYLQASGLNAQLVLAVPGAGTANGHGSTFTGSVGAVTRVTLNPNGGLTGTVFGHLAAFPALNSIVNLNLYQVSTGWTGPVTAWAGEPAGVRAGRLALEQGFQFRGIGDLLHSQAMGPQSVSDLVSLLNECEAADRGMLFEPRTVLGIGYRARSSLYNEAPLALNYASAQLGGTGTDLQPTYDDQFLRNDETVSRSGGSSNGASARYVLNDGSSMSTGVIGTYSNSDSLNVAYDAQLANLAPWIVRIGTVDEARWPAIPFNLARSELAALYYSILGQDLGDRAQISNLPNVVMYDAADQLAAQIKESLGGIWHTQEWAAVPASPYTVAVAGTARAATAGSQLTSGISAGQTTFQVTTTAGNVWTQAAGDFPLDIIISGERITISAISGTNSPQTFTASARAVNGVSKAHLAGEAVQVWTPAVAAL